MTKRVCAQSQQSCCVQRTESMTADKGAHCFGRPTGNQSIGLAAAIKAEMWQQQQQNNRTQLFGKRLSSCVKGGNETIGHCCARALDSHRTHRQTANISQNPISCELIYVITAFSSSSLGRSFPFNHADRSAHQSRGLFPFLCVTLRPKQKEKKVLPLSCRLCLDVQKRKEKGK